VYLYVYCDCINVSDVRQRVITVLTALPVAPLEQRAHRHMSQHRLTMSGHLTTKKWKAYICCVNPIGNFLYYLFPIIYLLHILEWLFV